MFLTFESARLVVNSEKNIANATPAHTCIQRHDSSRNKKVPAPTETAVSHALTINLLEWTSTHPEVTCPRRSSLHCPSHVHSRFFLPRPNKLFVRALIDSSLCFLISFYLTSIGLAPDIAIRVCGRRAQYCRGLRISSTDARTKKSNLLFRNPFSSFPKRRI